MLSIAFQVIMHHAGEHMVRDPQMKLFILQTRAQTCSSIYPHIPMIYTYDIPTCNEQNIWEVDGVAYFNWSGYTQQHPVTDICAFICNPSTGGARLHIGIGGNCSTYANQMLDTVDIVREYR